MANAMTGKRKIWSTSRYVRKASVVQHVNADRAVAFDSFLPT